MSSTNKKVLFVAGGTGGHVFPALAVADALRADGYQITWLGTERGIESRLVPAHQIPIQYLNVTGLRGKSWRTLITAPFKLVSALYNACRMIIQEQPALVVGMGGFVSGPVGLAAWLCRKPLLIHEQNAVAGTTNRILARLSEQVFTAFPQVFKQQQAKLTGNPIRQSIYDIEHPEQRYAKSDGPLKILVLGGSQGALALNQLIPETVSLLPEKNRPHVWHQCGQNLFEETKLKTKNLENYRVLPFIDDMAQAYAWADLVIARAGALTVAEIAGAGVASILVPLPTAIDDHQTKNAQYLSEQHAAILCPQQTLNAKRLLEILKPLTENKQKLKSMAIKAKSLATPQATHDLVDYCKEICARYAN